jgi:hypothetical protein
MALVLVLVLLVLVLVLEGGSVSAVAGSEFGSDLDTRG